MIVGIFAAIQRKKQNLVWAGRLSENNRVWIHWYYNEKYLLSSDLLKKFFNAGNNKIKNYILVFKDSSKIKYSKT